MRSALEKWLEEFSPAFLGQFRSCQLMPLVNTPVVAIVLQPAGGRIR